MSSRKVRVKKLSVKTTLPVLREDQIDPTEYEALTTENQIATGVEQAEEKVSISSPMFAPMLILISRVLTRDISWHPHSVSCNYGHDPIMCSLLASFDTAHGHVSSRNKLILMMHDVRNTICKPS